VLLRAAFGSSEADEAPRERNSANGREPPDNERGVMRNGRNPWIIVAGSPVVHSADETGSRS